MDATTPNNVGSCSELSSRALTINTCYVKLSAFDFTGDQSRKLKVTLLSFGEMLRVNLCLLLLLEKLMTALIVGQQC